MLEHKRYRDRIAGWEIRAGRVREFVECFAPADLRLEIIRLADPFGPAIAVPKIGALVVSPETLGGAEASILAVRSTH